MTPTSAWGGVLTGMIDGAVIALLVFAAIYLVGRFHRPTPAVRRVPAGRVDETRRPTRPGELPPPE
jgi:hypothetical protein